MNKYISIMTLVLSMGVLSACTQPETNTTPTQTPENMQTTNTQPTNEVVNDEPAETMDTTEAVALADGMYTANTDESMLFWKGAKITGSAHEGDIQIMMGDVEVMEGQLTSGNFMIDMTTINTTDLEGDSKQNMDDHLKNEDFFAVEEHPEATFDLVSAELQADNTVLVMGDLTIKGITNPIEMVAQLEMMDENKVMMNSEFTIDRTLWDIRYGSGTFFDDLGDNVINDEIEFRLELVLDRL
jgi:polyisoprenoid-binding protein YceI